MNPGRFFSTGDWKPAAVELFVLSNLAFLAVDIYVAHSVNRFAHRPEWIPFVFSIVAAAALGVAGIRDRFQPSGSLLGTIGMFCGYASIAVGIAGLAYHLESQFFQQWSLRSLVYTAPLAAPLSYAGLGFLLVLNRTVDRASSAWRQWLLFFALGGFVGNFLLSLGDHAQNGFFHWTEWIPVASSGFAIGFLLMALVDGSPSFRRSCLAVLALQVAVGIAGFFLHLQADINGLSASAYENFIHGAPIFAPLLFADLFVLGLIGLAGPGTDSLAADPAGREQAGSSS